MIQSRICKECNVEFPGGPRAYYCLSCRHDRAKKQNAEYRRKKRAGLVNRPLGSIDKCERCGNDYTVVGGLQRFCPECKPVHTIEYDRDTALSFYHENKERINPVRKVKRRKRDNKCEWCGNEFDPVNGSTTCSSECKRQMTNLYARAYRAKLRDKNTILGKRYTRLLVIEEIERKGKERQFLCKCDCTKVVPVLMLSLKSGNTKSCGCLKSDVSFVKDLTGQRFGSLTVRERSYEKTYNYNAFWLCDCDCGKTRIVSSPNLKNGTTKYCGKGCPFKRKKSPPTN